MVVLRPDEARRLLAALDHRDPFGPRDHAMLELALQTGLRVSELISLDVSMVAHQGVPRLTLFISAAIGKGGRSRQVPLNAAARQAVAELLAFNARRGFSTAPEAPLLVTRKHQRLSVRAVQRLMVELRERAGLDVPATPHSLRHAFGSNVARETGNLRIAQELLGHARLSTTQIYTHPTDNELRAAVDALC